MVAKQKTAIQYLIGTFLLSYLSWGVMIVFHQIEVMKYGSPVGSILFLLGGFSPTIVSCICLLKQKEVKDWKQIVKDVFGFKQKLSVYLLIILFLVISYIIHILGGKVFILQPFYMAIIMIPAMMFGGGLEEIGWRYLLQPTLEKKYNFVMASVIVGIIWALWHFPLFLIEGTNQNLHMSYPVFAVSTFGLAFVLALLKKLGRGVWPCILFHSSINAFSAVSFPIQETMLFTIFTTILEIIIVLIIYYLSFQSKRNESN